MHILRLDHFRLVVLVIANQLQRAARQALHMFDPALATDKQQIHAFLFRVAAFVPIIY
tara:strand:+ start:3056 stop:3229 length:174 start_codon:yes stop_codon:yes gene_type:complete